jgi:hypothetical protein
MIADLEAEIERVKARAVAKEAKAQPESKVLIAAVRALDKAARVAIEQRNDAMARALEAARAPLSEFLIAMGLRLPDRKPRRGGRRRKGTEAA